VAVTAAGTPRFLEDQGELSRVSVGSVDIYQGEDRMVDRQGGEVVVTTHRLLFHYAADPSLSRCWPLQQVKDIEFVTAGWFNSHKIAFVAEEALPAAKEGETAREPRRAPLKLSFQAGKAGADTIFSRLQASLRERVWETRDEDAAAVAAPPAAGAARGIGIDRIRREHEDRLAGQKELVAAGFRDVDSLEEKARAMASLAKRFAEARRAERARAEAAGGGEGGGAGADDGARLDVVLADLGIANPVTKLSSGSRYHEALALQLADVMRGYVDRAGGLIQLTEVYCRYNRARGTDLVSPDDVRSACEAMAGLGLGLRLHRLGSGTLVLRSDSHDEEALQGRLRELLRGKEVAAAAAGDPRGRWGGAFVGAADLAAALGVSLPVATSYLEAAEASGLVCRDDSLHGVRFYLTPGSLAPGA